MKLLLSCCLILSTGVNSFAMNAPNDNTKTPSENSQARRQLTLIDLDRIDKTEHFALDNEQKWKLHQDSKELIRTYAVKLAEANASLAELRQRAGPVGLSILFVNAQRPNPNNQERN